jgi:hypothetical protein
MLFDYFSNLAVWHLYISCFSIQLILYLCHDRRYVWSESIVILIVTNGFLEYWPAVLMSQLPHSVYSWSRWIRFWCSLRHDLGRRNRRWLVLMLLVLVLVYLRQCSWVCRLLPYIPIGISICSDMREWGWDDWLKSLYLLVHWHRLHRNLVRL